jgi:hypothetical protein
MSTATATTERLAYGFTCRGCGVTVEFTPAQLDDTMPRAHEERRALGLASDVRITDCDAADILRRDAGWGLTTTEYPYDGNAHYYCPRCHTPDEDTV